MSNKHKLFLVFFLGILAVVLMVASQLLPEKGKKATFFLSPPAASAEAGENFPLEIKFKGGGLLLSGVAVRLTSKFDRTLPPKFKDADPQKEGIQVEINPVFLEKGWVYPVNNVRIDSENGMIIVELAAINPMVTGFNAGPEENLATVNIIAQASGKELTFEFDHAQTKLITKEGREVRLNFDKGKNHLYY